MAFLGVLLGHQLRNPYLDGSASIAIGIILATVAVFLFSFYFPCLAPLIHQVTRPELRATAMALYLLVAHILGNALAPALIGWFSDQAGNLRLGIGVALGVALIGALIGLWGSRFVGPDTRAMLDKLGTER